MIVTETKVQSPAAMKAKLLRQMLVKRKVIYWGAGNLRRRQMYDINISAQVETSITKLRRRATWL